MLAETTLSTPRCARASLRLAHAPEDEQADCQATAYQAQQRFGSCQNGSGDDQGGGQQLGIGPHVRGASLTKLFNRSRIEADRQTAGAGHLLHLSDKLGRAERRPAERSRQLAPLPG